MEKKDMLVKIQNWKEKVDKKKVLIDKRTAQLNKKYEALEKLGIENPQGHSRLDLDEKDYSAFKWDKIDDLYSDVYDLKRSVENASNEIEKTMTSIAKMKQKLSEIENEERIHDNLPEVLKRMEEEIMERWNKFDIEQRDEIKCDHKKLPYEEFKKKYSYKLRERMWLTDDEIIRANKKAAYYLVMDLYRRVKDITGTIQDWSGIYCTQGNCGSVLNGIVKGENGTAAIESIYAGGYNIQRLHVRVLVKKYMNN